MLPIKDRIYLKNIEQKADTVINITNITIGGMILISIAIYLSLNYF